MKSLLQAFPFAGVILFFMGAVSGLGDDQPAESVALLRRARQLEELRTEASGPFLLRAQLKAAFGKKEIPGEYKLVWEAPNRWHEELVLADFKRIRVGVDGGYRQVRSWDYQPQVIFDIDNLLDFGRMLQIGPRETAGKPRTRKVEGTALSCVEIRLKYGLARELCFNPSTGLLAHAKLQPSLMPRTTDQPKVDYRGAISLADKTFPSTIQIQRGQGFSMEISTTNLELVEAKDRTLQVAPEHAEFWEDCRDSVPPELLNHKNPHFPEEAKARREQGIVSFYVRIEPDGTISHLKTLQAPSPSLERAAREAVEQWRYKPRSCRGTPVRDETIIEVSFWYQQ